MVLTSCAKDSLTSDTYSREDVRVVQDVKFGRITDVRPVKIEGDTQTGALLGFIAGGVLGSLIGGGDAVPAAGAVGGSLLGGTLGSHAEQKMNSSNGLGITVRINNGETVHVVQEVSPREEFLVGDRVRLISVGRETRISH